MKIIVVLLHLQDLLSRCVPISPVTQFSQNEGQRCERQQLPLRLTWAMTNHKSQGLTLKKAWVDLGTSEKTSGMT